LFTSLCIFPAGRPRWRPGKRLLGQILAYFSPSAIRVWGFNQPLRWDADEEAEPTTAFECMSVAEAVERARKACPVACHFFLDAREWSERIRRQLQNAPGVETHEHFAPYCPSVVLGAETVPDPGHRNTAAEYAFAVRLGGDGMPKNLERYREVALANEEIASLISFLARTTGLEWEVVFDLSY